jgi:hypothetical protein
MRRPTLEAGAGRCFERHLRERNLWINDREESDCGGDPEVDHGGILQGPGANAPFSLSRDRFQDKHHPSGGIRWQIIALRIAKSKSCNALRTLLAQSDRLK